MIVFTSHFHVLDIGFLALLKSPFKAVPERHEGEPDEHTEGSTELGNEGEVGVDPVLLLQLDLSGGVDKAHPVNLMEFLEVVDQTELTVAAGRQTASLLDNFSLLHLRQQEELSLVVPAIQNCNSRLQKDKRLT